MNGNLKKKIVIVGPAYPYRGGNSLYVTSVYNELKDYFDVKVYNYKLLYPSVLFPGTSQFDKSSATMNPAPNERVVNSINPFNWLRVASMLKKENADLVVFDWWHPFFSFCHYSISALIRKKYRNKILFITENVVSHESRWFEKTLTKIGLSNAAFFLGLSNVVENDLKKYFPSKRIFRSELPVYDCYDMQQKFNDAETRKELGIAQNEPVLLFFGYIRKYKGLNVLISAMPEILKALPGVKLLIVGEFYEGEENYRRQASELKLDDKIIFVNRFVPNEEVEKFYSVSDLVVMPYLSATQSGVLNVAYGFEKPVVVTHVGGLTESVEEGKTGIIIQPDDKQSLTDGVLKFFSIRNSVNFKENIRKKVKENAFSKLHEVFNDILQQAG
jgi:glycosyltransferase involved in cell wall biosynthesis